MYCRHSPLRRAESETSPDARVCPKRIFISVNHGIIHTISPVLAVISLPDIQYLVPDHHVESYVRLDSAFHAETEEAHELGEAWPDGSGVQSGLLTFDAIPHAGVRVDTSLCHDDHHPYHASTTYSQALMVVCWYFGFRAQGHEGSDIGRAGQLGHTGWTRLGQQLR